MANEFANWVDRIKAGKSDWHETETTITKDLSGHVTEISTTSKAGNAITANVVASQHYQEQAELEKLRERALMSQTDARALARQRNGSSDEDSHALIWIAVPYPFNSWGGHEKGWTVRLVPAP